MQRASRRVLRLAWPVQTVLVLAYTLVVLTAKFNGDRLARTLDALSQHRREIWQDVVHRAFVQAEIDLNLIMTDSG